MTVSHLLEELFVCSFDDDGVSIAHHGDQHVEEQDGDQDLEQNEHGLRHGGVVALLDIFILRQERSDCILNFSANLIFSERHVEQSYPGGRVAVVHTVLLPSLQHEEEGLGEAEEEDDVDDGEGEHVSSDHGEDHGHEGSCQFDGPGKEHEIEPGHRHCEHQQRLLYDAILRGLLFPWTEEFSSNWWKYVTFLT